MGGVSSSSTLVYQPCTQLIPEVTASEIQDIPDGFDTIIESKDYQIFCIRLSKLGTNWINLDHLTTEFKYFLKTHITLLSNQNGTLVQCKDSFANCQDGTFSLTPKFASFRFRGVVCMAWVYGDNVGVVQLNSFFVPSPFFHSQAKQKQEIKETKVEPDTQEVKTGLEEKKVIEVLPKSLQHTSLLVEFAKVIHDFYHAHVKEMPSDEQDVLIYRPKEGKWKRDGSVYAKPWKYIILPEKEKQALYDDLQSFLSYQENKMLKKMGFVWRRSYGFFGVPGSGKTSTIHSLAALHKKHLALLSFSSADMNDEKLQELVSHLPDDSWLVLEDFDRMLETKNSNLSLSTILNVLDGYSNVRTITFLTANNMDQVDEAFQRAGRCDYRMAFNYVTRQQAADTCKLLFPEDEKLALTFGQTIPEGYHTISMASVMEFFKRNIARSASELAQMLPSFSWNSILEDSRYEKS